MIRPTDAWIISTFTQAILYGIYIATLLLCLRWLCFEDEGWRFRPIRRVNWFMLTITITIFVLSTADLGMTLRETIYPVNGAFPESNKLDIVNNAVENVTILITDAVLILRCWVVYGKSWRAVFLPLLSWTCDVTCTIFLIYWRSMSIANPSKQTWYYSMSNQALVAFFSFNFATNVYAALAILYRILPTARENRDNAGFLYIACCIFAESGILYATTSLLILVARVVDSDGLVGWISDAINFSMAGIAFNLILFRVAQYQASRTTINVQSQYEFPSELRHSRLSAPIIDPRNLYD